MSSRLSNQTKEHLFMSACLLKCKKTSPLLTQLAPDPERPDHILNDADEIEKVMAEVVG